VDGERLVYYRQAADPSYWDDVWRQQLKRQPYRAALKGRLTFLERAAVRYLPREGRVLEAGCGLGQFVLALRRRGWDAEGVDYAEETVQAVRAALPDLPIRTGDVTRLDVPDNSYSGYISLGVVEHRRDGPGPFLEEARRILRPGGVALISVPFFNPLRRLKARWGSFGQSPRDLAFYQYAFTKDEFRRLLVQAGFEPIDCYPYDGEKGIRDEFPYARLPLRCLTQLPLVGRVVKRRLQHSRIGHMLMFVARKPESVAGAFLRAA
jgi:SAM-dependent methyltransferase